MEGNYFLSKEASAVLMDRIAVRVDALIKAAAWPFSRSKPTTAPAPSPIPSPTSNGPAVSRDPAVKPMRVWQQPRWKGNPPPAPEPEPTLFDKPPLDARPAGQYTPQAAPEKPVDQWMPPRSYPMGGPHGNILQVHQNTLKQMEMKLRDVHKLNKLMEKARSAPQVTPEQKKEIRRRCQMAYQTLAGTLKSISDKYKDGFGEAAAALLAEISWQQAMNMPLVQATKVLNHVFQKLRSAQNEVKNNPERGNAIGDDLKGEVGRASQMEQPSDEDMRGIHDEAEMAHEKAIRDRAYRRHLNANGVSNWWKMAQAVITDFDDRNIVNDKIDDLKKITVALTKSAKLVFQTGSLTRVRLGEIIDSKRLSSYPKIEDLVLRAAEACLDSPQRVSVLCKAAAAEIVIRVGKLEKERKDFARKSGDPLDKYKGWKA